MTARAPSEPVRVTSWLAGWLDYVFATALIAGRWLRLPLSQPDPEPVFRSAFAPALAHGSAPHWHESDQRERGSFVVKVLEILMLSVSFFLAAHLLSGGTPTAVAPNLNPFGLLPEHARAQTVQVPAVSLQVDVPASAFSVDLPRAETVAPQPAPAVKLAPADKPAVEAAAVNNTPSNTTNSAPAIATPAPPPPAPAVAPSPTTVVRPELTSRYLSIDEFQTVALAAGWSASELDDLTSVALCESHFHTHAEYWGALGLMQVMPVWFDEADLDLAMWADPVTNLRAAKAAFDYSVGVYGNGWAQWTCRPPGN